MQYDLRQLYIIIYQSKPGDNLLASETKIFTWNVPQDVKKEVTYSSKGPKITQADFYVETVR